MNKTGQRPLAHVEAMELLSKVDHMVSAEGFAPQPEARQPKRKDTHPIWVRLYDRTDGDAGHVSLAFTDDDLRCPPTEFGLMVDLALHKARRPECHRTDSGSDSGA